MMISDLELLKYAAKAAGIKYKLEQEGYAYGDFGIVPKGWRRCWNPLNNNSDVVELSIVLRISIEHNVLILANGGYGITAWIELPDGEIIEHDELYGNDPTAATRRAIVNVAAKFGRNMK